MDMCLEQTINKSAKSPGGIIGNTKKKNYVARWQLIFHELLQVRELHCELCGIKVENTELTIHHEFSPTEIAAEEGKIIDMIDYIKSKENPCNVTDATQKKLHNVITQEIATEEIRKDLLCFGKKSKELYQNFRNERFIEKEKKIADTIHRVKMKTFKTLHAAPGGEKKKQKNVTKELSEVQKIVDIARVRQYDMKMLFL